MITATHAGNSPKSYRHLVGLNRAKRVSWIVLVVLSGSPVAYAWTSSENGALFKPVHQMAIDKVLTMLSDQDRATLKNQQVIVDKDQAAAQSAEHAMTGLVSSGPNEPAARIHYIQASNEWVRNHLSDAIQARAQHRTNDAMVALGVALHALEDATSPSHEQFQEWSDNEGLWEMAMHVTHERSYPDNSTLNRYKKHLEGAVRYAYDIFMGVAPMPAFFFDPNDQGRLALPTTYLTGD